MENEKTVPILSICIPTYNQPSTVRRLIESLAFQYIPQIEIVIRDDSVNNETEVIVKEFQKKIPINYYRGEKEGLDVAILFLTQKAIGKYVWWIGDDAIESDAVINVIKILNLPDVSFVYLNSKERKNSILTFPHRKDGFFIDKNEVLEEVADLLGFISTTIFEREKVISGISDAKGYIGSAWVNLYLVLHVLSQSDRSYFIEKPYISSDSRDPSVPTWYDALKVFTINFFNVLHAFDGRFDGKSLKRALEKNFNRVWRGILVYRAKGYKHGLGGFSINTLDIMKCYWNFPQFWIALPLFLTPRPILSVFYKTFKLVKNIFCSHSKK